MAQSKLKHGPMTLGSTMTPLEKIMLEALEHIEASLSAKAWASGLETHIAEACGLDDELNIVREVIAKVKGETCR